MIPRRLQKPDEAGFCVRLIAQGAWGGCAQGPEMGRCQQEILAGCRLPDPDSLLDEPDRSSGSRGLVRRDATYVLEGRHAKERVVRVARSHGGDTTRSAVIAVPGALLHSPWGVLHMQMTPEKEEAIRGGFLGRYRTRALPGFGHAAARPAARCLAEHARQLAL